MRRYIISFGVQSDPRYFEWAFIALVFAALSYAMWEMAKQGPIYEYENVKILKKHDLFHYRMAKADGEFEAEFCKDYEPELIEGCVLDRLRYEDRRNCWSVRATDLGYWYRHNASGDDVDEKGQICWKAN